MTTQERARLAADPPDGEQLVEVATSMVPRIRACADEIERTRRLPLPLVTELAQAGIFRMLVPRAIGGSEIDPVSYMEIIEILSEGTRRLDETVKLDLYDRYGVPEYWTFDISRKATRVYRRTLQGRRLVAELSAEARDVLTAPLLPGIEIPLAEIFE